MAFDSSLASEIWNGKYRFKPVGGAGDSNLAATWDRVASALAEAETSKGREHWKTRFRAALEDCRFMPAGRVIAGAGTGRNVTLFNCFVMGAIPDDLSGIFRHLREAALTMQQGGGVGMDFSTIRPTGARVKGVGADASGPLSFMDVWDGMCRTIMSAGQRRGAMMGCLRIDHPDIEAFIDAKRDPGRLRNFNLSVLVTDAFMTALQSDADWPLVFGGETYRTVRAVELWEHLMRTTYDVAEPGVIFIDRVNASNNLRGCETIHASNPCGEQMLPPYGACLLGSINLARLIQRPFEADAGIDEAALGELTRTAVRMLDNVIDVSRFPLKSQEAEAKAKRRIGLGVTGLADALIFCGVRYGSDLSVDLTRQWLGVVRREAYRASAELAAEKGVFPLYDVSMLERPNLAALDEETRDLIRVHGLRNGCLTSIAPTGTTSLLAGNVSSGIEPVFAFDYVRKLLQPDGSRREEPVQDYAVAVWRRLKGAHARLEDAPGDAFVSAQTLTPSDHLKMQAAAQTCIDSSISKTINCPEDISFDAFSDVYVEGYRLGCKGLTTYRPNAVTGSVLSVSATSGTPAPSQDPAPLEPRPDQLTGATYKIRWPLDAHAVYVTINDVEVKGAPPRPFEIFVNSKNMAHYAWTVALTRMVSAVFRRGGDVGFVAEELKAVFDPAGGAWLEGAYTPSLPAAIGAVISRHLKGLGVGVETDQAAPVATMTDFNAAVPAPAICPGCGAPGLQSKEGCDSCLECGYSRCG